MPELLGTSTKVEKGEKKGYLTAVMYLSPATESVPFGGGNLCPHATAGCATACLGHSSGRLAMSHHKKSRLRKTEFFFRDRAGFRAALEKDIRAHVRRAAKKGLTPCVRLNGSSDIPWESVFPGLLESFPGVQFYDYTKFQSRATAWARGELPPNYHLTFSRAETNEESAFAVLRAGGNVAVVFSGGLPVHWGGVPVIDGDETDLRFTDPRGCVVGLKAKGAGKKDVSGFVVRV